VSDRLSGLDCYGEALRKYAVFQGRAGRREYWYFILFNFLVAFFIGFAAGFIKGATEGNVDLTFANGIYVLATLLPGIAVGVRRMHDTGRSGWWLLLPIVNLVFLVEKGDVNSNGYGASALATGAPAAAPSARGDVTRGSMGAMEQIERLAAMRDRGILTEEEFQAKKRDLL
jgi:uncharacterized membrane protein YhaH (DUF805 family)